MKKENNISIQGKHSKPILLDVFYNKNKSKTEISATAFEIALKQLI